jgi:hypothetical protein
MRRLQASAVLDQSERTCFALKELDCAEGAPTVSVSGGEPLLYVVELLHRVSNEYASAISLASVMGSRASSHEAKSALETVIEHLVQLATAHRVLLPPVVDGTVHLGDYLDAALPSQSGGGARAAGTTLRLAVGSPWHSTLRAAGASDLSSPSSSPTRRATACRQGAAKFSFRPASTAVGSYAA